MSLSWSHAVIYVRDLEKMLEFYAEVLGFEVADRGPIGPPGSPDIVFISQVETEHHQLAFLPIRQGDEKPNSIDHMAFRTDSLTDLRAMGDTLEKDGRATDITPLCHGSSWSYYFKDPEGNGVEVFCDSPWHVAQPQGKRWDPSLSDDELRAWTEKEFGGEKEFGPIDAYYASRVAHFAKD